MEWCKTNTKAKQRAFEGNYAGLIRYKYFNVHSVSYGVDNNNQIGLTKQEYTIDQVKALIEYTVSEVKPIVSEDYTGRWIIALADNPSCTGVKAGEVIKIIGKPRSYILDKTANGVSGMSIPYPLQTSKWELIEEPKENVVKLSSFPSSGAILIEECDNLKEFKRFLFESGKTCNEAVGNPKYLSWNGTSFLYPTTGTGKTMYKWDELKHFIPTKKDDSDDILEKARRLYPIGTEFISNLGSFSGHIQTVKAVLSWYDDKKESITHRGIGWVYFDGKWAEIVKPASKQEQDPLYICKQKYRKGMKVRSASKEGMYSGEFIIEVTPDKFTGRDNSVDYFKSKGFLYCNGEYAEILEEGIYDISEIIKTNKPSIETVHSVDVNLRTKKQINKFKF